MTQENSDIVDRVVRTVDAQTSSMQPDRIPASKIIMHLADHGRMTPDEVRAALDQAVQDGRLERNETDVWIPDGS